MTKGRRSSFIIPPQSKPSTASQPSTSTQSTSTTVRNQPQETQQSLAELKGRIESLESALREVEIINQHQAQLIRELSGKITKFAEEEILREEKSHVENFCEVRNLPESVLVDPIASTIELSRQIRFPLNVEDFTSSSTHGVLTIEFRSLFQKRGFVAAGKLFNRLHKKFNGQQKIFVNDKLTSAEKKILYETKVYGRSAGYKFIWHVNGSTHIKRNETTTPIVIKCTLDLDNLKEADRNLLSERQRVEDQD